jgi:hypothetical protein
VIRAAKEASASFSEEKEAKRLLLIWAGGVQNLRLQRLFPFNALKRQSERRRTG